MKKIMLICLFLIGISAASFAQRLSPAAKAKELQKELKLTNAQTSKISAIFASSSVKLDSIKTASKGNNEAVEKAVPALRVATNAKVKKVLTATQAKNYDKVMKAKMSQNSNGWGWTQ